MKWRAVAAGGLLLLGHSAHADDSVYADEHRPTQKRTAVEVRAEVGYVRHRFYNLPISAFDASIGLGISWAQRLSIYGMFDMQVGKLLHLGEATYRTGVALELVFGRVRVPFGFLLGAMNITRVTSGPDILGFVVSMFVAPSVDIVRINGNHAVFLATRLEWGGGGGASLWGPSVTLGARY